MILITGGTGRLGTLLVERLNARGSDVRVLTRDAAKAEHLHLPPGRVAVGDVRDRTSLAEACDGVQLVVSAAHGFVGPRGISPATVDQVGNFNLIEAAQSAGASVVLMSMVGASQDSPLELARMKFEAERYLKASGVEWTIVRPTAYMELWVELLKAMGAKSGRPLIFGRGNNPINLVSVIDVAALVDKIIDDRSTRGSVLEIGGPENITFNQLAAEVQAAAGRTAGPRHIPRPALWVMAQTIGRLKPELGRQAKAALVMDRAPLTFESNAIRERYPDLPCTTLSALLATQTA